MSRFRALLSGSLGSVAAGAVRAVEALITAWERRRLVGQLGQLDDHMLRDIGITRQDVTSALAEPLFRDPTESLASRAAETRQARRANAALAMYASTAEPDGDRRAA